MKYMKQIAIIFGVTCIGEFLNYFLPLPVPASIYGLILMLVLLVTHVIKIEHVDAVGTFLVEIMPMMFIPAGVGLVTSFEKLRPVLFPVLVITVVTTFLVMAVTGKVTDAVIGKASAAGGAPDGSNLVEDISRASLCGVEAGESDGGMEAGTPDSGIEVSKAADRAKI